MRRPFHRLILPLVVVSSVLIAYPGSSGASSKPTYTLAYEGPLSGGNAQLGLNMEFAVQLAIKQANAGKTFGTLPFTLKFLAEDDQGSASQSPTAAQALINNSSVEAVVGPAFSGATKAAEPAFSAANLATVSPSATEPDLATQGWGNFFRVVADDNAQGPGDAQYAAKVLKVKKVYSVDDASAYATGLVTAFNTAAKGLGMTVTHQTAPGTTQCQAGTGDVSEYGALASQIKSSGDPATFYAGYYCDFALLAKALRTAGYTGQLISDDGSLDPKFVSQAGASVANKTLISCACADLTTGAAATSFAKQFKSLAHFAIGTYSAEAYDAANATISVMKAVGAHLTRAKVVAGLKHVNYKGLTKTVKFTSNGDIASTAVYIYQVKSGKITTLGLLTQLVK
ncbi:MAG TPA: branched-chain amino acid ABC transporter substrate-binding protein [Acidimicrobiales bacterium]|jgi:branched-chain amino acid transport system substrate-binding protein|nr:branched-chain amino acid ABC transporter substrate-binding protein [Acidimicrobiales bacterium]